MLDSTLVALLQQTKWRANFDAATLQRARAYADHGHVTGLQHQRIDQGYALRAEVIGSAGRRYDCELGLIPDRDGLEVDTECSCPVGYECKHAAAILMVAAASAVRSVQSVPKGRTHLPGSEIDSWNRWLQGFSSPHADTSHQAEAGRSFGIVLRADDTFGEWRLLAQPVWVRPSKSGKGLVDPKPLQLHGELGAVPVPDGGWPAHTAAALVTLLQAPKVQVASKTWAVIHAGYQEHALEHLLERYPVWYQRASNPLERGPELPLRLEWQQLEDGSQRLAAMLDADDAVVLKAPGLWYVQPKRGRYGRVQGNAQMLERLQMAPVLQPEQIVAFRKRLKKLPEASHLPPPQDPGPIEPVEAAPVPVLHLRHDMLFSWNGRSCETGIARLAFDYDGIRINAEHGSAMSVRRIQDGRLREARRDRAAENAAWQGLASHGIRSAHEKPYNLDVYALQRHDLLLYTGHNRTPCDPRQWRQTIDKLLAAGYRIEYARDFPRDELVEIDDWFGELTPSGNAWFDLSLGIEVGGEKIDLLPLLRQMLADPKFPRIAPKGEKENATWRVKLDEVRSVELPLQRLRNLIEPLLEWLETEFQGEPRIHQSRAAELDGMAVPWRGGDALRAQLARLEAARKPAGTPRGFKAKLRPYQSDGLAWLNFLGKAGLGGILADDMGLGKTVQVLAHILYLKQGKQLPQPVLVVAPTSLVGNWASEAARFAPRLKVLVIHGSERGQRFADIADYDLVITTYPLLPRDRDQLIEASFALLVLDEAHAIKNPRSQAAQVVRELRASRRLAMTGTPLENHLGELWAQFDAVEPGLLGSEGQFRRQYRTPIEKHGDGERQQRLNRRIGALLLRRSKDQVLDDLPPKNEILRSLELEGAQRELYETLRLAQHKRVREAVQQRGLAQSGIIVLDALLKLRQACCDPRLVKIASARKLRQSAKLDALLELLDGLIDEGRRVLVFSQFTEMLGLIETALDQRKVAYQSLTGQTPGSKRAALVQRFQNGKVPVFLISLKAGGVGLNLTAADTVIHYDPWWNPAVEAQATDRAHRIGQDKPVFVYRLICAGTVEEKIQAMQARKAELARAVLEGGASKKLRFDEADLAELFGPA